MRQETYKCRGRWVQWPAVGRSPPARHDHGLWPSSPRHQTYQLETCLPLWLPPLDLLLHIFLPHTTGTSHVHLLKSTPRTRCRRARHPSGPARSHRPSAPTLRNARCFLSPSLPHFSHVPKRNLSPGFLLEVSPTRQGPELGSHQSPPQFLFHFSITY